MLKKNMNMSTLGSIHSRIDEDDWLSAVRDFFNNRSAELDHELEQILHSRPTICKVPRDMAAANPAAFTPQCISLGPYHRGRADLYAMERYKLASALRFYSAGLETGGLTFEESVIQNMKKRERCIRNCYDTFIDCRAETLAWLVTIDAMFLLDCLQLRDGHAAAFNWVRKDMIKLENQLPLFALENILRLQFGEKAPCKLADLLLKTLTPLSPISPGSIDAAAKRQLPARAHLLDALYFMLVPSLSPISQPDLLEQEELVPSVEQEQQEQQEIYKEEVTQALSLLWKLLSSLQAKWVKHTVDALTKVSSSLLKIVASHGSLRNLRTFAGSATTTTADAEDTEEDNMSVEIEIPPTRDELAVPSVAELKKAGVRFCVAAEGGVRSVRFDAKSRTLHLPAMRVTAQTETVLLNLIAYEASLPPCRSRGAMEFTRFVDFVNGIVDSVEDVQILKQCGVLRHHLQTDLEVANLFNGMGACVKLPRLDYLNAVVREVNAFYQCTWKVKVANTVNSYVFGLWKILSLLAALIMLALTCLEASCSIYECKKWLDSSALE